MKKVVNINIGGIVFAIEHDAYDVLAVYLESVKQNISTDNADTSEVIDDIERAIAEKFTARKRNEKAAVTNADVTLVIAEMGNPSEFNEAEEVDEIYKNQTETEDSTSEAKKQLYRDTEDTVIAGVASGLAQYFDIDPVIVRLIFVVSIFFNGLGILAYILLWLIVPAAKTTADKYAMRGEHVTLKDISERVRKNLNNFDSSSIDTAKGVWGTLRDILNKSFKFLGLITRSFFSAARYVVGFVFLIGGALATASLVSVYSVVLLSDKAFIPKDAQTALDIMLSSSLGIVAILASFVMMLIPFLVLVLIGGGLVAKRNLFTAGKSISLAVIWIISIMLAGTTSILLVQQVIPVLNPERFENGQYEIHIKIEDDNIEIDTTEISPKEEDVPSAPPNNKPIDLE